MSEDDSFAEDDEIREGEIDAQYEQAYAGVTDPLGEDFEGWPNEGIERGVGAGQEEPPS